MSLVIYDQYEQKRRSVGHFDDATIVNGWQTIADQTNGTKRITTLKGTAHTATASETPTTPYADVLMDWYAILLFKVVDDEWAEHYGHKVWSATHGKPYWSDHLDFYVRPIKRNILPWKLYVVRGTSVGGHGTEWDTGGLYPKDLPGNAGNLIVSGLPLDLPRGAYVPMLLTRATAAAEPYGGLDSLRENSGLGQYLYVNGMGINQWVQTANPTSGTLAAFSIALDPGGQYLGADTATKPGAAETFHFAEWKDYPAPAHYEGFYVKPSQRLLIRVNQKMA